MRATLVFLLLAGICFAEQPERKQDKKTPSPRPLADEEVAAAVSALLKPDSSAGEWCKTPMIGLILGQQDQAVQKAKPEPKPEPSARRD